MISFLITVAFLALLLWLVTSVIPIQPAWLKTVFTAILGFVLAVVVIKFVLGMAGIWV